MATPNSGPEEGVVTRAPGMENAPARHSASARSAADRGEQGRSARRALLALAIALMQLVAGMPLLAHGFDAAPGLASAAMHPLLRPALLLSTLVVVGIGRAIFVRAWAALTTRTVDVSTLVALGSGTAVLYSTAATILPSSFATDAHLPAVHFEAASALLAFALLGRAIEGRVESPGLPTRAPVPRAADRLSAALAPAILVIATAAAIGAAAFGPEPRLIHALTTFVAVVVVSCPCALALATPTAIAPATYRAAQLGMLVRSGEALERAALVDTVAIDKAGTLTEGEPELVELVPVGTPDDLDADAILRLAAAVERGSEHPVGRAILAEAAARKLDVPDPNDVAASAGAGARAEVEGHDVRVGAMAWLASEDVPTEGTRPEAAFGIAIDGVLRAYGLVADRLRDDASDAVVRLHALGIKVVVLTADREDVARAVAAELSVDELEAGLSPEGKLAALGRLTAQGRRVAMCGDGVDDAPALAQAYLGVALGSAADSARDADITLPTGALTGLPDMLQLARRTRRVIRQNLAWAVVYNLALVPLAAGALARWCGPRMPPALVPAAMALSVVSVVLSALRLRRFDPK